MLDREVIKDFLIAEFEDTNPIPKDIDLDKLAEDFSIYTENDHYEWLKDNFKSYFTYYCIFFFTLRRWLIVVVVIPITQVNMGMLRMNMIIRNRTNVLRGYNGERNARDDINV